MRMDARSLLRIQRADTRVVRAALVHADAVRPAHDASNHRLGLKHTRKDDIYRHYALGYVPGRIRDSDGMMPVNLRE